MTTLLVLLGGALGATLRWLVEQYATTERWPRATFVVNVSGSFALGLLVGLAPSRLVLTALGTGVLGAYTTFSAYAVECLKGTRRAGFGYGAGSVAACVLAAFVGLHLH